MQANGDGVIGMVFFLLALKIEAKAVQYLKPDF